MIRFATTSILSAMLLISTTALAQGSAPVSVDKSAAATSIEQDSVDVQHVMDAYHQAVTTHNGARLASLFIPEGSVWLNVLSDEAYARAKAKSPDAQKIRVGSYKDFAKVVSSTKSDFNPTHTNMQLHSDGTIASVYFDFVFLIDGKEQNRGSETWQLVKGAQGWRIAAITYSSYPVTR